MLASLALAACGGGSSSSSGSSGEAGSESTSEEGEGGSGSVEPKTIGILDVLEASESAYRAQAATEEAVEHVGWKDVVIDAQGDPTKSAAGMTSLVNQKVDAIVSIANQPETIQDGLRQAQEAGIPVIAIGGEVAPSELIAAEYAPNEEEMTEALNKFFFERLEGTNGQIGVITAPIFYALKIRDEKLKEDLKSQPNVKVVAEHETVVTNAIQDTINTTETFLSAHPEMAGIWTDLDTDIPPAAQVLKAKGLCGKVVLVGYYGDKPNLKALNEGCATGVVDTAIEASGYMAIDALLGDFVNGTEIPPKPEYSTNFFAPEIITKENAPKNPEEGVKPAIDYVSYFNKKWEKEYGIK
ncbi:MAG TPA: sugar ABC transporter substrate-binding protein [Solirubrobacterales bacterium]|nr:sugar ABC transporter substrate-binding protein [Solirubrobacterales bacterium]